MFKSPFWEKVCAAAHRTDSTLYQVFKDLCTAHTPIHKIHFTVSETGNGQNGYRVAQSYDYGIEILHVSQWEAWEHVLKMFDPFNNFGNKECGS